MALFTDPAVVTLADLLEYEASLAGVASSYGIDVDNKISLATNAISDKLMLWLLNSGASDPQWLTRRLLGLSTVVVTPSLQRWICFESLSRVFAEAYNVQLNTRFQGKLTEYQQESKSACDLFYQSGLAIVYGPLPKPAMPLVSVQTGNLPAQSIFIQTAWVDPTGDESALSIANASVLPDNSSFAVAMAEGALGAPSTAAGWNVYVGNVSEDLTKQNEAPLAIGSTWQLPTSELQVGPNPIDGQAPAFTLRFQSRSGEVEMIPKSLLAAQKLSAKLTTASALQQQITALAAQSSITVPTITPEQVVLSSASPELLDMNIQLTYPRVCLYSSNVKNAQVEKFRSFSGQVSLAVCAEKGVTE